MINGRQVSEELLKIHDITKWPSSSDLRDHHSIRSRHRVEGKSSYRCTCGNNYQG
jgi:hypothetical protein